MTSSSRRQHVRALLIHLALLAGSASADVVPTFVWQFKTLTATSLPECGRLQILVNSTGGSTAPKPPYTFIAYEAAGIPTTQLLGSDPNNLWWTVDHASQTQLILTMADAAGNAGGVAPNVYSVISSTNGTSCHAQNPTSPVSVTTNTTKSITSCDVLPLKMSGGTKPYTISVASLGSSITTNFTLGSAFDTYDWVNRASPNSKLIAAVSDANGVYAPSTDILSTFGSTDLTCGNLPSTEIDSEGHTPSVQVGVDDTTSQNSSNSSSNKPSTATIIVVAVGGALLLAVIAMGAYFFFRQQKVKTRDPRADPTDDSYGGLGLGKVRGPGPGSVLSEETAPFVAPAGSGIPYMDNPYEHGSYSSRYSTSVSEDMYAPAIQAQGSTYAFASNLPPEIMTYPTQQFPTVFNTMSAPLMSQAAPRALMSISTRPESFVPHRSSVGATIAPSMAPTTPTESISGGMIAGPSTGLTDAVSTSSAGSGSQMAMAMAMAMDETRPSTSRVVGPIPVQGRTDIKRGIVPPPPRQQSVYQHEDVSDVVELPPAYKERTRDQ